MKFMNLKKKLAPVLMGGALAVATAVPVLASESAGTGLSSVESALTTSFTSIAASMTSIVGKILPIALPIMGILLVVGFGMKAFKKVTNKAG